MRYFAGARTAAGIREEALPVPPGRTLDELVSELTDRHGSRLGTVLAAASFLVDGVACRDRRLPLPEAAVIDVLPPFAGG